MKRIFLLMGLSIFLMAGNCVQAHVVPYENPSEAYLDITGTIDHDLEYVVSVMYVKNARESGCPTYGKDSELCQIKPETFTYVPVIKDQMHSVHIPLKELSPETNSWWEPHDISICVGPTDPNSVPHQCQVVFTVTKERHDGHRKINLVCSSDFWCSQGLPVERVSQLNREFEVNLLKESLVHGPTTKTILDDLLKNGKGTEYVDRVLADLEQWDGPTLLIASKLAIREERINDGMLLYQAGTIRIQVDRKHYQPLEKGGNGPAPAIQSLMFSIQMQMSQLSASELEVVYDAIVPELKKWNPQYSGTYAPGWMFEPDLNLQQVQTQFNDAKAKRIKTLHGLMTLYRDETYAEAHAIVQAYEWDYSQNQQVEEKLQAEQTLERIETELGIKGYMAALIKQRELMTWTQCSEHSADGNQAACGTNNAHQ